MKISEHRHSERKGDKRRQREEESSLEQILPLQPQHLDSQISSRQDWDKKFLLTYTDCDTLLWQPQQTNTHVKVERTVWWNIPSYSLPDPSFLHTITAAAAAAKSLQLCPTVRPHRRQPSRLPRPWDSPGKNTGVGCHFLLQCISKTDGSFK